MLNEARELFELGDGPLNWVAVRTAYVRRAETVRLEDDPARFMRLRAAYELLSHDAPSAPLAEVEAAREELQAHPDSTEARWRLLSYFPYGLRPEPAFILSDGANRNPDQFLDELMLAFPQKVPPELLQRAEDGAGIGRLLLVADVHAVQGRPVDSLRTFRAALHRADSIRSPAILQLALRPLFSMQERAQTEAASEALAILTTRAGTSVVDTRTADWKTHTMFEVAEELGRLGPSFPLELRQVVARAGKRANFDNAPYDARFVAERMKPREVRKLIEQLKREAPTLAKILSLEMIKLKQTGLLESRSFRPVLSWVTIAVAVVVVLRILSMVYRITHGSMNNTEKLLQSVTDEMVNDQAKDIEKACSDPASDRCKDYRSLFSEPSRDGKGERSATKNIRQPERGHDLP